MHGTLTLTEIVLLTSASGSATNATKILQKCHLTPVRVEISDHSVHKMHRDPSPGYFAGIPLRRGEPRISGSPVSILDPSVVLPTFTSISDPPICGNQLPAKNPLSAGLSLDATLDFKYSTVQYTSPYGTVDSWRSLVTLSRSIARLNSRA
jgi:hypothetical protein